MTANGLCLLIMLTVGWGNVGESVERPHPITCTFLQGAGRIFLARKLLLVLEEHVELPPEITSINMLILESFAWTMPFSPFSFFIRTQKLPFPLQSELSNLIILKRLKFWIWARKTWLRGWRMLWTASLVSTQQEQHCIMTLLETRITITIQNKQQQKHKYTCILCSLHKLGSKKFHKKIWR